MAKENYFESSVSSNFEPLTGIFVDKDNFSSSLSEDRINGVYIHGDNNSANYQEMKNLSGAQTLAKLKESVPTTIDRIDYKASDNKTSSFQELQKKGQTISEMKNVAPTVTEMKNVTPVVTDNKTSSYQEIKNVTPKTSDLKGIEVIYDDSKPKVTEMKNVTQANKFSEERIDGVVLKDVKNPAEYQEMKNVTPKTSDLKGIEVIYDDSKPKVTEMKNVTQANKFSEERIDGVVLNDLKNTSETMVDKNISYFEDRVAPNTKKSFLENVIVDDHTGSLERINGVVLKDVKNPEEIAIANLINKKDGNFFEEIEVNPNKKSFFDDAIIDDLKEALKEPTIVKKPNGSKKEFTSVITDYLKEKDVPLKNGIHIEGTHQMHRYGDIVINDDPVPYDSAEEMNNMREVIDDIDLLIKDIDAFNDESYNVVSSFGRAVSYSSDVCKEKMEALKNYAEQNMSSAMNNVGQYDANMEEIKNVLKPVVSDFSKVKFLDNGTISIPDGGSTVLRYSALGRAELLYKRNRAIKDRLESLTNEKIDRAA